MSRQTRTFSITHAAALSGTRIVIACTPDEDDVGTSFTRLLHYDDGIWTADDLNQQTTMLCHFHASASTPSLLAMSRTGALTELNGLNSPTKIEDISLRGKPYRLGYLYCLRQVGSDLYAAGSGGQTYRREANGTWRVLDETLLDGPYPNRGWISEYLENPNLLDDPVMEQHLAARLMQEKSKIFWTLAGTSQNAIYFGGEQANGLLYLWDGTQFSTCELPMDKALRDIIIAPDGTVWICGREGILLRGRGRHFEIAADLGPEARFASLAWFNDRLFIGASSGPHALYVYDGATAAAVHTGLDQNPDDAHTVQTAGDALWVVGSKSLFRLCGQKWDWIPIPESVF